MKLNQAPYILRRDRFAEDEWIFDESGEARQATEEFDGILELARMPSSKARAASLLRKFLKRYPWHFDAFTHFAIWQHSQGKIIEAYAFYQTAVALAKDCFPREFDASLHRIPGGFVQNRPYLRAVFNLMDCCGVLGYHEKAVELGFELLHLDENDRMNVRWELPKYLLHRSQYDAAVELFGTEIYKDTFHQAIYLYPLALLHLGRRKDAITAIATCLKLPRIAKYLLHPDLPRPVSDSRFGGWSSGSELEGFHYAQDYKPLWQNCPEALDLLETSSEEAEKAGWPGFL